VADLKQETINGEVPTVVIRPSRSWVPINLGDLWSYRELLYFLIWREIKVRYKQTVLGFGWAIIQPLFMMIVFSLFFGNLAKVPSEGIPYPLFNYSALLPWTLFAEGINRSSNSLIQSTGLVQKVYFPRLIMPFSGILSPVVDFAIAFLIMIGLMFYYGYAPNVNVLWLPAFIILALMAALGVGLWLAAINVKYRDVRYATPFLIQLWLFASPVVYSSSLLPEKYQVLYGINPMSGVIEGFRWALLGTKPPGYLIAVSIAIVVIILISGIYYFKHSEKMFADVI
jgi:lipopolysaccharide transport system permease protein